MAKKTKTLIEVKPRDHKDWSRLLESFVNDSKLSNVGIYPRDGEVRLFLDNGHYNDLVLNADGTWNLD